MKSESPFPIEWMRLLHGAIEDRLQPDEWRDFEAKLLAEAAYRRLFVELCHLHTELHFHAQSKRASDASMALIDTLRRSQTESGESSSELASTSEKSTPIDKPSIDPRASAAQASTASIEKRDWLARLAWPVAIASTLAAIAASITLIVVWSTPPAKEIVAAPAPPPPALPVYVARLIQSVDAKWEPGGAAFEAPAHLPARETLKLAAGLVELRFRGGAWCVIEGPAEFVVESQSSGILRRGRIAARVGPEASGFTVQTPTINIIDLGTEFGVAVDADGDSEVHVFKGVVEVQRTDASIPQTRPIVLTTNQARRFHVTQPKAKLKVAPIPLRPETFVRYVGAPPKQGVVQSRFGHQVLRHVAEHVGHRDPVQEGWTGTGLLSLPDSPVVARPVIGETTPAGSFDAWNIRDDSGDRASGGYERLLSQTESRLARQQGWVLSATFRNLPIQPSPAGSSIVWFRDGERRFAFRFSHRNGISFDPPGLTVFALSAADQSIAAVAMASEGDLNYQSIELVYAPTERTATLFFNGVPLLTEYEGFDDPGAPAVFFGADNLRRRGNTHWNHVQMSILPPEQGVQVPALSGLFSPVPSGPESVFFR